LCAGLPAARPQRPFVCFEKAFAKKASPMGLNKKQKKQLDVERKKIAKLQQILTAARQQTDEPDEIARLEGEIAACKQRIESIQDE
jgi:hypothetical protein